MTITKIQVLQLAESLGDTAMNYTSHVTISQTTQTQVELKVLALNRNGEGELVLSATQSTAPQELRLRIESRGGDLRQQVDMQGLDENSLSWLKGKLDRNLRDQLRIATLSKESVKPKEILNQLQKKLYQGLYKNLLYRDNIHTAILFNRLGVIEVKAGKTQLQITVGNGEVVTHDGRKITIDHDDVNNISKIMALVL